MADEKQVNIVRQDAYFDTTQGVNYFAGTNGFKLDIDKSIEVICQALADGVLDNIELIGDIDLAKYNEKYVGIDTMTSSFVTYFNEWEGTRPINLKTGVNYLNGAIIDNVYDSDEVLFVRNNEAIAIYKKYDNYNAIDDMEATLHIDMSWLVTVIILLIIHYIVILLYDKKYN